MSFEDIKKLDDAYVMHTYGRYNLAIDHGSVKIDELEAYIAEKIDF